MHFLYLYTQFCSPCFTSAAAIYAGLVMETNFDIDFGSNIRNLNSFDFDFDSNINKLKNFDFDSIRYIEIISI
jgi:hypothetical protein